VLLLGPGLLLMTVGPLTWAWFLMLWAATGLSYAATITPQGRLLRRSAAPDDRPALFTAQFALSHACWLMTYPLAGWALSTRGPATAFILLGLMAGLGLWIALRVWPVEDAAVAHSHTDLPPDHPHLRAHGGPVHAHDPVNDEIHHNGPLRA